MGTQVQLTKGQVIDRLRAHFPRWTKGRWVILSYLPDADPEASCWCCEYRYRKSRKAYAYYPHDDSVIDF